mmetsp:Transcript_97293/g.280750  ORF Transcript_97293/g.280750 Transcript_97293/m.280750 type:complete len:245 (-) Transcript_97293:362-1096(-)
MDDGRGAVEELRLQAPCCGKLRAVSLPEALQVVLKDPLVAKGHDLTVHPPPVLSDDAPAAQVAAPILALAEQLAELRVPNHHPQLGGRTRLLRRNGKAVVLQPIATPDWLHLHRPHLIDAVECGVAGAHLHPHARISHQLHPFPADPLYAQHIALRENAHGSRGRRRRRSNNHLLVVHDPRLAEARQCAQNDATDDQPRLPHTMDTFVDDRDVAISGWKRQWQRTSECPCAHNEAEPTSRPDDL